MGVDNFFNLIFFYKIITNQIFFSGHKSDTVAQRYIDQSTMMKQRASDVLSLGGLQLNDDGEQLRKRTFESGRSTEISEKTRKCRTYEDKENAPGTVYNITFNYCSKVNYQLPIKSKFD